MSSISINEAVEFVDICYALKEVENTPGTNAKLALLGTYEELPGFKEVLKFIYNPYFKTGISQQKVKQVYTMASAEVVTYKGIMQYLLNHNTGSLEDLRKVSQFLFTVYTIPNILKASENTEDDYTDINVSKLTHLLSEYAEAIVTQKLNLGVSTKSLNKVYGKAFIPVVGVMLGSKLTDNVKSVYWPSIVTEKLDGVRRALIKENGKITLVSRSGKVDEGLVDIIKEAEYLPDNYVYDGEIIANGEYKDCIALRQATNSICASKGNRTGVSFHVFDMVRIEDFYAGISTMPAIERKVRLGALLKDESIQLLTPDWKKWIYGMDAGSEYTFIKSVPILGIASTLDEVMSYARGIWDKNGEGVMLNYIDGPYEVKRSKYLVKVKATKEYVLTVTGMQEGKGEFEGMLGALLVEYKGNVVGVGSGLNHYQRQIYWDNPDTVIGSLAEIESFGESTNAKGDVSLNCPIFKRLRKEEE